MKRYPKPDFARINAARLRAHYAYIHALTSDYGWIEAWTGSVGCRLCTYHGVAFGRCGLWPHRFRRWLRRAYYALKFWPYNTARRFEMWDNHRRGQWCRIIENGQCVGCGRTRPQTPYVTGA